MTDPFTDAADFAGNVAEIVIDPEFGFHRDLTIAAILDRLAAYLRETEATEAIEGLQNLARSIRCRVMA